MKNPGRWSGHNGVSTLEHGNELKTGDHDIPFPSRNSPWTDFWGRLGRCNDSCPFVVLISDFYAQSHV